MAHADTMDELKRAAAHRAVEFIASGMVVGLGSGSTARFATLRLAERLRAGELHDIVAVPTSEETAHLAQQEGIVLTTLDEHARIAVTIDGADEVDPQLNLIKGKGGHMLQEKIVAVASEREIIVVDESKLVERLGSVAAVPVEVVRFGWRNTEAALRRTGARTCLRMAGANPFITDEGNYIIDCVYEGGIAAPRGLELALQIIPGVVGNGLFLGLAHAVVVARTAGIDVLWR